MVTVKEFVFEHPVVSLIVFWLVLVFVSDFADLIMRPVCRWPY